MGGCLSSSASPPSEAKAKQETQPEAVAPKKPETAPTASKRDVVVGSVTLRDEDGNERLGVEDDRKTMEEEEYDYPSTLQEELNEVLEAVYEVISEEDIQNYQRYLDDIAKQEIAEQSAKAKTPAPVFELVDQDNERTSLEQLCQKGPVVLQFYRGKWCPHCNAGLMKYNKYLPKIKEHGASLVAISPMLPDGSQFLASKRDLDYAVLSDCGNTVARKYKVTFVVPEFIRPTFESWGHDVPKANGDDLWEIPLAATFVINKKREIVWSFVDNDHGVWAEPSDVVQALETCCKNSPPENEIINHNGKTRGKGSVKAQKPDKSVFGPKKQSAAEYVSAYPI
eukprot:CAMPEP_0197460726 /NCGR_PEP_ID=MMETSP1175-20131217/54763_1 /TAXON_ID=1003142 /ORGANISM="Triceratium dubium, Strain CCMP147" /LENGTH=338 /DNA_ID=CAMNT_0042995875 /DNA_START=104 /DNA_END=1120 /DNA_ORIENTATION=+